MTVGYARNQTISRATAAEYKTLAAAAYKSFQQQKNTSDRLTADYNQQAAVESDVPATLRQTLDDVTKASATLTQFAPTNQPCDEFAATGDPMSQLGEYLRAR